jgi:hypothetical protein
MAASTTDMTESKDLRRARELLAQAEAKYHSSQGLTQLEEGLALLDAVIALPDARQRSIAENIATTYASRIFGTIALLLDGDRAVPEPQLEHLFKVVLAFDQGDFRLPANARAIKIEIARRLIDRYYEGHSPEAKRLALEQLTKLSE